MVIIDTTDDETKLIVLPRLAGVEISIHGPDRTPTALLDVDEAESLIRQLKLAIYHVRTGDEGDSKEFMP